MGSGGDQKGHGKGTGRKTRRSRSSVDGCSSIVMPIGGEELLNNQQMVLFRRSSSLSAERQPIFELDPSSVAGRRKKSSRGLIIPSLVNRRAPRKKMESSGDKGQSTELVEHSGSDNHECSVDELLTVGKMGMEAGGSSSNWKLKSKGVKSMEHMRLSDKYEPKLFEEIVGHELNIRALSNAIDHKGKIAPLYLFHGPHGTGKSCTARIFAMASNCVSSWPCKPCWICKGCSRSLQLIELFSGTTTTAFDRIKSILHTTDLQATKGTKIFIIEDSHLLQKEAWEELLEVVDKSRGITFVLITGDPSRLPESVSSRCQKFSFQKLTDIDISLKLARIVAHEGIQINREALFLVTQQADGSLREAENILDQLALLSSRITPRIVRQLVGLVCEDKLTELLNTAMSLDPINTARQTKELLAVGIEPEILVSQLASRIADILSMPDNYSATTSHGKSRKGILSLTSEVSDRLSHALKILIETEKQLHSSNNSNKRTWLISAMLQLASHNTTEWSINLALPQDGHPSTREHVDNEKLTEFDLKKLGNLIEDKRNGKQVQQKIETETSARAMHPHNVSSEGINTGRHFNEATASLVQMSNMEQIWTNILANIQSDHIRQFLHQGTLASLTVSRANAIVHLIFKCMEDKKSAEKSEENISKALEEALGCPVIVNLSLQPTEGAVNPNMSNCSQISKMSGNRHNSNLQQKQHLQTFEQPHSSEVELVLRRTTSQKTEPTMTMNSLRQQELKPPYDGSSPQRSRVDEYMYYLDTRHTTRHRNSGRASISKRAQNKHRLHSVSSNQQNDVSVEPYSQDLRFENANTERKPATRRKSKVHASTPADKLAHKPQEKSDGNWNQSWCCTDKF